MIKLIDITNKYSVKTKLHFSENLIDDVYFNEQDIDIKSSGIWYSWGNHWLKYLHYPQNKNWWTNNRLKKYKYTYKLILNKLKLIKLKQLKDFVKFTFTYGIKTNNIRPSKYINYLLNRNSHKAEFYKSFHYSYVINWKLVARNYSGIDIRFNDRASEEFYWYESWDVSSGCIWNKNAIQDIKLINGAYNEN